MILINKKGFTLIEVIFACFILGSATLFIVPITRSICTLLEENRLSDDEIQIHQIRLIIACSTNVNVQNNYISCDYLGKPINIKFHHHRIVKTPGYEIFLEDISNAYFSEDNNYIYLYWKRKDYESKTFIGIK